MKNQKQQSNKNPDGNNILCGIDQIQKACGGVSHVTLMSWKREYKDFPMKKLGGQWVSYRELLNDWWRNFIVTAEE